MVAAIVVTYNRKKLLYECLLNLKKSEYRDLMILVIDNASTDGTYQHIKELIDDRIKYINTGENLGGAGGFAYGMKKAFSYNCDYLWLMDDDCIVNEKTLNYLIKTSEDLNGNFGFLSSVVKWNDGSLCEMNLSRNKLFFKVRTIKKNLTPIIFSSFVSLFVPRNVVKDIGLPIKDFYIWADDWEYTRRISKKYKSYLVKESTVVHKCKNNIGGDISKDSEERMERYRYLYRNEAYLFSKEVFWGWIVLELGRLYVHSLRVVLRKNSNKIYKLRLIWSSAKMGIYFTPEIEYIQEDD